MFGDMIDSLGGVFRFPLCPPLSRDVYIGYEVKVFIGVILGVLCTCYPPLSRDVSSGRR